MSPRSFLAVIASLTVQAAAGGLNVPLPPNNIFDYVVIGGGPAGLTVANRLTEDPAITVLVLEAGYPDQYETAVMVPAFQGQAGLTPQGQCGGYNWCDVRGRVHSVSSCRDTSKLIHVASSRRSQYLRCI